MKVAIPGVAFGALKDSGLPREDPDFWRRVEKYSVTLTRGRGISVHIEMDAPDLRTIRDRLGSIVFKLSTQPYPVRGIEGNIIMQSASIAADRLDEALRGHVDS